MATPAFTTSVPLLRQRCTPAPALSSRRTMNMVSDAPAPPATGGLTRRVSRTQVSRQPRPSGKRVPTYKKMQQRRKEGPAAHRARTATTAPLSAPSRGELRPRRKLDRPGVPLRELHVGAEMEGVVQNMVPHGAFVDVGATRDGLVHVRDMSVQFVHSPEDFLRSGDKVCVWVKYVDAVNNVLGLTMVKPKLGFEERIELKEIQMGERYEGIVERVTNYGAYVDIGATRLGFVHVAALWGRRPRETLEFLRLGQQIWVHVDDVDEVRSHIKLRARGRADTKLQREGQLGELAVVEESDENVASVTSTTDAAVDISRVAVLRPGQSLEEEEDDEAMEGDDEDEDDEDDVFRDGDDVDEDEDVQFLAEDQGVLQLVEMQEEPEMADIAHMFDDNTEFIDVDRTELKL